MFGIYYIPPAQTPLYQVASQVMGYDVRTGEQLTGDNSARARFRRFDPTWTAAAQEFGFHATIGHVMTYEGGMLPRIEAALEATLDLFDPLQPFLLRPSADWLRIDGPNLTLYYEANQPLLMFHALVVAHIHPLGIATPFSETYAGVQQHNLTLAQHHKTGSI